MTISKWRIVWSDSRREYERTVTSGEEVLAFVLRTHAKAPRPRPMVEVLREPKGYPALSMAVGSDESIVTLELDRNPPYFISLGDPQREGMSDVVCHGMQVGGHLARNVISWNDALETLQEFLTREEKPERIAWETL